MRIVICSRQRLLASALEFCLHGEGDNVAALVADPDSLPSVALRLRPDVLVVDATSDLPWATADLGIAVVRLAAASEMLRAGSAAEQTTVAARTASLSAVVELIHHAGRAPATATRRPGAATATHAPMRRGPADYLTTREREVLGQLVLGAGTTLLAKRLGISRATARCHIQSVLTKMHVHSRIELVSTVLRGRLVDPTTGTFSEQHPCDAPASARP